MNTLERGARPGSNLNRKKHELRRFRLDRAHVPLQLDGISHIALRPSRADVRIGVSAAEESQRQRSGSVLKVNLNSQPKQTDVID